MSYKYLSLLFLTGCFRNSPELPEPLEGVFVSGQVFERSRESGEVEPRAGVRIRAAGRSDSVLSGNDGFFRLERLALGPLRLIAERRGPSGTVQAGRYLNLSVDGQSVNVGRLTISADGSIAGSVILDTADGPEPALGAIVVLPGTPYEAVSAQSGFVIRNIPPGVFDVVALQPGLQPARLFDIPVEPASRRLVSDLVLSAPVGSDTQTYAGAVRLQDGSNPAGIAVTFQNVISTSTGAAMTGEDGSYAIDLVPGLYRTRFAKEGFVTLEVVNVVALPEGLVGLGEVELATLVLNDADGDGIPDGEDFDSDNDGVPNAQDEFPLDPTRARDTDGDGTPDARDPDDDNDLLPDAEELSPGRDGFVTNPLNADTDGDGQKDDRDACPLDPDLNCLPTSGPEVTVRITEVAPTTVTWGERLEVRGAGLGDFRNLVFRFRGDVGGAVGAFAIAGTSTYAATIVPDGAQSGLLEILSQGQLVVATTDLQVNGRIRFRAIEPQPVNPGGVIAIYITGESVLPATIYLDDLATSGVACSDAQVSAARAGESVLCVEVPAGVTRLRVEAASGASGEANLRVQPGPRVTRIGPNPNVRGGTLVIEGNNLNLEANQMATVEFNGVTAVPTSVNASRIEVTIPMSATTGNVVVQHPRGAARAPRNLVLEDDRVIPFRMRPRAIRGGYTDVEVLGQNLAAVTTVRLPGGVLGTNVRSTQTSILFDIPAGAALVPGVVRFEGAPSGPVDSEFRIQVLQTVDTLTIPTAFSTLVEVGPNGVLYSYANGRAWTYEVSTGVEQVFNRNLGSRTAGIVIPGTRYLVTGSSAPSVELVDLLSGSVFATCNDLTVNVGSAQYITADPLRRFVFIGDSSRTRIDRINLQTGTCERIDLPTGTFASYLLYSFSSPELFVRTTQAMVAMDMEPGNGIADGTIVESWTPASSLVAGARNRRGIFFGIDGFGGVSRGESGRLPQVQGGRLTSTLGYIYDPDRTPNYLVDFDFDQLVLFDLEDEEYVSNGEQVINTGPSFAGNMMTDTIQDRIYLPVETSQNRTTVTYQVIDILK